MQHHLYLIPHGVRIRPAAWQCAPRCPSPRPVLFPKSYTRLYAVLGRVAKQPHAVDRTVGPPRPYRKMERSQTRLGGRWLSNPSNVPRVIVTVVSEAFLQTVASLVRVTECADQLYTDSRLNLLASSTAPWSCRPRMPLRVDSSTSFSSSPSSESKPASELLVSATTILPCACCLQKDGIVSPVNAACILARKDDVPLDIVSSGRYWL